MFGSIIGDITANCYSVDSSHVNHDGYTIYTLYTIAIADALIHISKHSNKDTIEKAIQESIQKWIILEDNHESIDLIYPALTAVGWLYDSLEETLHVSTMIMDLLDSKNTKEAAAFVTIVYLARMKYSKDQIMRYMSLYHTDQNSLVYQAFMKFKQSNDFVSTIYAALEAKQHANILAIMCGAFAQAYYGYHSILVVKAMIVLSTPIRKFCFEYTKYMRHENPFLTINEQIIQSIKQYNQDRCIENRNQICYAFDVCIDLYSHIVIPISVSTSYHQNNEVKNQYTIHKEINEKGTWLIGYLNHHEAEIGYRGPVMVSNTLEYLQYASSKKVDGILIDQYSYQLYLSLDMIYQILNERMKEIH